jgi:hypothetical protein
MSHDFFAPLSISVCVCVCVCVYVAIRDPLFKLRAFGDVYVLPSEPLVNAIILYSRFVIKPESTNKEHINYQK